MEGVLADVEDPDSGGSLLDAWSGELQTLGSGSDYAGEGSEETKRFGVAGDRGGGCAVSLGWRGRSNKVATVFRGIYWRTVQGGRVREYLFGGYFIVWRRRTPTVPYRTAPRRTSQQSTAHSTASAVCGGGGVPLLLAICRVATTILLFPRARIVLCLPRFFFSVPRPPRHRYGGLRVPAGPRGGIRRL